MRGRQIHNRGETRLPSNVNWDLGFKHHGGQREGEGKAGGYKLGDVDQDERAGTRANTEYL